MIVAVGAPPSSAARQYWWRQLRWRSCCDWWRAAELRWLGAQRAQCRHSNQASSTQHSKAAVCVSCVGDSNIDNAVSVQFPVSSVTIGQWSPVVPSARPGDPSSPAPVSGDWSQRQCSADHRSDNIS